MPRDPKAEAAEKAKHKEIADAIEGVTKAVTKSGIPQIKGLLELNDQEEKMLAGGIGALTTVASGYYTGKWVDAAFKIAGFISGMFAKTQDPTAAALARIEADSADMFKLLTLHFDAQAALELQNRVVKVNTRLRDCIAKFPPGVGDDVAWMSTFDYQQLDAYATEAFGVVDELLGVADGAPFVPALWNRTYDQKSDFVGMPFWRHTDDDNIGQLFFTLKDPDAAESPLDAPGVRFDYRMPLSILASVLPQVVAIMRLRDPFFQTTGRFSERLTSWADALHGKIAESIEACILRSDHVRLSRIFNRFAGTDDWFVSPVPAGAVNFVTGESVFVGWAPGVSVQWADLSKRTFKVHEFNSLAWPWPGQVALHAKDLPPFEAFAKAGYGPFVDHCVDMMRQTLPLPQIRSLASTLRELTTTPPSSETFGADVSIGLATYTVEQVSSDAGTIRFRGIDYDAHRRFVTTESVLARPYQQRLGEGIYFHSPGTRPRRSGAIIQWPLRSIFSNEAYPIAYTFNIEDSDGTRHVLNAETIDSGGVRGARESERNYSGTFDVACETFDFITGPQAPPIGLRWGDQSPDVIAVGGTPAAAAPVTPIPQTELFLHDRLPFGLIANQRPSRITGSWSITVSGGMLGLGIRWDGSRNASNVSLVIEESRAYRPGGPPGPAPITTLPILVTQDQLFVDDHAYWDAVAKAEDEYLGLITRIWFVVDKQFRPRIVFPDGPWDVPVELKTVEGLLHRIPGGVDNPDLRQSLQETPGLWRLLNR